MPDVRTAPKSSGTVLASVVNARQSLESTLERLFSHSPAESRLQQARRIMGQAVDGLSDEQLEVYLTEFQYLINTWLDEYEQFVFQGKTLKEILREG